MPFAVFPDGALDSRHLCLPVGETTITADVGRAIERHIFGIIDMGAAESDAAAVCRAAVRLLIRPINSANVPLKRRPLSTKEREREGERERERRYYIA